MALSMAHLYDADRWNSQAYDKHKAQQYIKKGMSMVGDDHIQTVPRQNTSQ
jgi:hypothetical protein